MAMQRIGNYYGNVTETISQDGRTIHVHLGPWHQLVAMRNVLCEDGKERTIYTREPDTFFTVPGRTSAYGKTVTGFVSYDDDRERFTFKATGKYRDLLTEKAAEAYADAWIDYNVPADAERAERQNWEEVTT